MAQPQRGKLTDSENRPPALTEELAPDLHERRLNSWYRNFRLASPGNDAPRFEEAARGSVIGSKSLSERLRGAFFERLRAPVAVQIGRGIAGIYGVHFDRGFYLSRNELDLAAERSAEWCIYRVHLFVKEPRVLTIVPPLENVVILRPETWRASF